MANMWSIILIIYFYFRIFSETQNALLVLADTDIHAVAGLLKLYFRDLPQCLFTGKLYRKFVEGLSKLSFCYSDLPMGEEETAIIC